MLIFVFNTQNSASLVSGPKCLLLEVTTISSLLSQNILQRMMNLGSGIYEALDTLSVI